MKAILSKLTFVAAMALSFGLIACNEKNGTDAAHGDHADHAGDAAAQTHCPVSGEELGSMGEPIVMMHEGKEVKLCCKSCIKKFEADPATYAAKVH